jgi:hypothetical protein
MLGHWNGPLAVVNNRIMVPGRPVPAESDSREILGASSGVQPHPAPPPAPAEPQAEPAPSPAPEAAPPPPRINNRRKQHEP